MLSMRLMTRTSVMQARITRESQKRRKRTARLTMRAMRKNLSTQKILGTTICPHLISIVSKRESAKLRKS